MALIVVILIVLDVIAVRLSIFVHVVIIVTLDVRIYDRYHLPAVRCQLVPCEPG